VIFVRYMEEIIVTRPLTDVPGRAAEDVLAYPMPRAAGCPLDPSPELSELQVKAPLVRIRLWDGSTPWLVTRHAEHRALLVDPRLSADATLPGYPDISEHFKECRATWPADFMSMDNSEHARLRRMVTGPFTNRRIETLRPAVQQIADRLIDDLLAGSKPADLVSAFALPVPSLVICHLLGVPYEDHDFFQDSSRALVSSNTSVQAAQKTQAALLSYLDCLIGHKLAAPEDDLLSHLAVERVSTGQLTRQELASMSLLLLTSGYETTANMIALGTLALLCHPSQLAMLRQTDDPGLIAASVEELLRYLSIVHLGRRRVALEDIEIAGQVIRAGEGVVMATELANRDEAVFSRPGMLDVRRDARQHLAFGFGIHQCLGQPLARMELQVVCGTLYRRIPALALAASLSDIRFKHDAIVYGVYELPVTW
jgi:cytochrome P450